jgi:hypothetical protein
MNKVTILSFFLVLIFGLSSLLVGCTFRNGEYAVREAEAKLDYERELLAEGERIFNKNCKQCHQKAENFVTLKVMGPAYFQEYIGYQDSLLNAGDKFALELKEKLGNNNYRHNFKPDNKKMSLLIKYMESQPAAGCD